jgi:hypothetical protein
MELVRKIVRKQVIQHSFFKNCGTNVAGTLCLNRKNVPPTVKNAKLKKGEVISQQSNGVMVIKREDNKRCHNDINFP